MLLFTKMFIVDYFLNKSSLPVYDGVMNEKIQITRYLNFKGDFSFKQRLFQAYYEFIGNPVNAIFNTIVILVNPKMLVNDFDVQLRALFTISILFFTLERFMNLRGLAKYICILCLFCFPLFNHFRFGLMTYVPDLTSGVLLISGYLNLLIFIKNHKVKYFILSLILVFLSIGFRFNFFVYVFLVFFPYIFPLYNIIIKKNIRSKMLYLLIVIGFLFLCFSYIYIHLDFFLNYYKSPAVYAETNLTISIVDIFNYFKRELGWTFLFLLLTFFLINNLSQENSENSKINFFNNLKLAYPFLVLFSFLIFFLNASNQPHVFSFLFTTSLPLASIKLSFFNRFKNIISECKLKIIGLFVLIFSISGFTYQLKYDYKKELNSDGLILAEKIDEELKFLKRKKYFIIFDAALETPLDVYFYRKTKIWNNNQLQFYFTDWHLYGLSNSLDLDELKMQYISKINEIKPDLIFMNVEELNLVRSRNLSIDLNNEIKKFVKGSKAYYNKGYFYYNNQLIATYKRK
jgi:hypothetical protein